jgi:hypothetical protein
VSIWKIIAFLPELLENDSIKQKLFSPIEAGNNWSNGNQIAGYRLTNNH